MNHVVIIGRLTADPETRATQSNTTVANYTLAVDRGVKSADGQQQTDWIDCVAFAKSGDFAVRFLKKGTKIAVEGRIQTRNWEDKNGNKRKSVEVIVDRHEFCESKHGGAATGGAFELAGDIPDAWAADAGEILPF
jgi:single-strand DNA-binding protein